MTVLESHTSMSDEDFKLLINYILNKNLQNILYFLLELIRKNNTDSSIEIDIIHCHYMGQYNKEVYSFFENTICQHLFNSYNIKTRYQFY